jgi:Kdo2-lipid IVA lauroyltransferase/acyltransferase
LPRINNMLNKLATYTGIQCIRLVTKIPLSILYLVSDGLYLLVYFVFRYRREVVRDNLMNSFPGKSVKELLQIEKHYYRILCDLVVETIKTPAFSSGEMSRRMIFRNPEILDSFFEKGRSVIVLSMHHGNWEWLLHMPLFVKHHPFFVYKPLHDKLLDQYMNSIRERFGGETVSMSLALRKLLESEKNGIPVLTWLAADQTPPWNHPYWTMFMHQKTQFFNGPAKLAQRFDLPVFFQQVKRIRRGYYETWFTLLFENPKEVPEETITQAYVRKVEKVIIDAPEDYLWSHRRWKNKKHAPEQFL